MRGALRTIGAAWRHSRAIGAQQRAARQQRGLERRRRRDQAEARQNRKDDSEAFEAAKKDGAKRAYEAHSENRSGDSLLWRLTKAFILAPFQIVFGVVRTLAFVTVVGAGVLAGIHLGAQWLTGETGRRLQAVRDAIHVRKDVIVEHLASRKRAAEKHNEEAEPPAALKEEAAADAPSDVQPGDQPDTPPDDHPSGRSTSIEYKQPSLPRGDEGPAALGKGPLVSTPPSGSRSLAIAVNLCVKWPGSYASGREWGLAAAKKSAVKYCAETTQEPGCAVIAELDGTKHTGCIVIAELPPGLTREFGGSSLAVRIAHDLPYARVTREETAFADMLRRKYARRLGDRPLPVASYCNNGHSIAYPGWDLR